MSVELQEQRKVYTGNGVADTFAFPFTLENGSQVKVVVANEAGQETELTYGSDYVVSFDEEPSGITQSTGSVELNSALPSGYKIALISNIPEDQQRTFPNNTPYYQEQVEGGIDKNTRLIQQISEEVGRSVKIPVTDTQTPEQFAQELFEAKADAETAANNASGYALNASQTLSNVNSAGSAYLDLISSGGSAQLADISSSGNLYLNQISSGGSAVLNAISSGGSAQVAAVTSEGNTQAARLEQYASGVIQNATSLYTVATTTLSSNIPSGATITTPLVNGAALSYWVGKDMLGLSYNGIELYKDLQYQEVGSAGTTSYKVKTLMPMYAGDQLCFKAMAAIVDSVVADPLQPDGTSIQINANNKLSVVLTDQAITQAIGYTAADDSAVVKLTGNQTISGEKTFQNKITASSVYAEKGSGYGSAYMLPLTDFGGVYVNNGKTDSTAHAMNLQCNTYGNAGLYDNTFGHWAIQVNSDGNTALTQGDVGVTNNLTVSKGLTVSSGYINASGVKNDSGIARLVATNSGTDKYVQVNGSSGNAGVNTNFAPLTNNTYSLGLSSVKWSVVYAATGTINTSDERAKTSISVIPENVLDAWGKTQWCQYKLNDAVEKKGEAARLHTGLIAQHTSSAFAEEGLDASRYGFFCYDKWEAEPEEIDEDGEIITQAIPAGDAYSMRYDEALCIEAAYQRRRADRAEARIKALEDRLTVLETRMEN